MEQSRTGEAIPLLQKAVELAPKDAICRLKLGTAYLRLGKLIDARRDWKRRCNSRRMIRPRTINGKLYKEMKAVDRAKAEFDRNGGTPEPCRILQTAIGS